MKKQRKMVYHSIKSKYPSLRKNQECKEGENRMVQGQQEGEQCYLIRIISTLQNWTQGKRQGFKPSYKMKFGITWSISPYVCDSCCLSGSPGTNTEIVIMTINSGRKGRGCRCLSFHLCSRLGRGLYFPSLCYCSAPVLSLGQCGSWMQQELGLGSCAS
jgi:hypothetical protein